MAAQAPVFRLGYNTNGLAHHRLLDALSLLAELGYEGVAVTPDVGQLDPYRLDRALVAEVRRRSDELGLALAVETGARYVLDARRKHRPTLLEDAPAERLRRVDFLRRCVDLASELGAGVVSMWAGSAPGGAVGDPSGGEGATAPEVERLFERLCEGVRAVLAHGRERGVCIAFEPEPGMFVERPSGYEALAARLGDEGDELGLCLDVGHLLCTGDVPADAVIRRLGPRLVQVHLDDIAGGRHDHLMFGRGELDLAACLRALLEVDYLGMAAVELSRDSHRGAVAAEEAMMHLRRALAETAGG